MRTMAELLIGEAAKGAGVSAPTCRGLCQIITAAETDGMDDVNLHLNSPRSKRGRAPKR